MAPTPKDCLDTAAKLTESLDDPHCYHEALIAKAYKGSLAAGSTITIKILTYPVQDMRSKLLAASESALLFLCGPESDLHYCPGVGGPFGVARAQPAHIDGDSSLSGLLHDVRATLAEPDGDDSAMILAWSRSTEGVDEILRVHDSLPLRRRLVVDSILVRAGSYEPVRRDVEALIAEQGSKDILHNIDINSLQSALLDVTSDGVLSIAGLLCGSPSVVLRRTGMRVLSAHANAADLNLTRHLADDNDPVIAFQAEQLIEHRLAKTPPNRISFKQFMQAPETNKEAWDSWVDSEAPGLSSR